MIPNFLPEWAEGLDEWIGGGGIPAYFVMLIMGFVVTIGLGVVWAKRSRYDHNIIIDLGLGALIFGVLGARILHVFVDGYFMDYVHLCTDPSLVGWQITQSQCTQVEGIWDAAATVCRPSEGDCFAWAKFWNGGLVWYGGLIGAGAYGIRFMYKEDIPTLKAMDFTGMVVPLGVYFGRLGCWFGGCCFGVESDHWSAVSFPAWSPASEAQFRAGHLLHPYAESLPVLPMQLWEAGACLAISIFCTLWLHPRKRFDGQVFAVSMALYAIVRIVLESFRADDRGALAGISTSQWIGVAIVAAMIVLYMRFKRFGAAKLARPFVEPVTSGADGAAPAPDGDEEE